MRKLIIILLFSPVYLLAQRNPGNNSFITRNEASNYPYSTTATAAGTTTLVATDNHLQYFTGSSTQTVVLPVVSTLYTGFCFEVDNLSTGAVTVQSSGANTIVVLAAGTSGIFTCISTSGTGTASWAFWYGAMTIASGKVGTLSNTLTFTGTDGSSVAFGAGGTVAYTNVATLASLTSIGTIGTGVWQGTVVGSTYGGTGVNNAGRTLTINTNSGTIAFGASSKTLTVNNSIGLTGTDATTITMPAATGKVDGWTYFFVSGSDATTTGQALTDITGLVTGTLSNSTKYEIEAYLDCTVSAVTTGNQYAIATGGTGGASVVNALCTATTTSAAATTVTINTAATATIAFLTSSGSNGIVWIKGQVTTRGSGTATISIQHLKNTSGTSTVRIGSWFRYRLAGNN